MDRETGKTRAYTHDPKDPRSIPSNKVMSLRHDRRGDLWIGTLDAGLARLTPSTGAVRRYAADKGRPDGLSANGVTAIVEDRRGRLWLGTYGGGLERFDPDTERFTHHRHDPANPASLGGDRVAAIAEAPDGRLWVGTMEKGLDILDPRSGVFRHVRHRADDAASLASDVVHTIFIDDDGSAWVGTHAGLSHVTGTGTVVRNYTSRDGLPSDVVYGVRSDATGRLWLSTNNGLSRFDPAKEEFVNYAVSDGLQGSEFNFGAWYQAATGELFFGGLNGFNAFTPDALRDSSAAPAVVLTGLTVGHRPLGGPPDHARDVRLGFRDKVLGLEFAALDFAAPHRNRFLYKLEGFDPDWVPLAGRHSVTYTNLNPGRYTFRLRAANSYGRWNEEGIAIPVEVAAAPWATPWAYAAYVLMLIGGIAGIANIQQRKFHREAEYARALEQRVQERTRELSERQLELERANHELAQASLTDSLTGLANRRFLTEYLEKETALLHRRYRKQGDVKTAPDQLDLAFVMIDLDQFKMINDSAGHAAGDAVLRQIRDVLRSVSRNSDLAVRWGGDEFLLVARELTGEGLVELVERIRARIGEHVFDIGEGRVVRTTASLGFACYPFFREQLDALSWEQVISVADRALYVAKASGRNAWVGFQPGIAALPIQGLFGAICNHPQQLVREGTLRVISSLTGVRNLAWEPAREAVAR
jgi:diguanylate cyclase (GGDEF)-like protein